VELRAPLSPSFGPAEDERTDDALRVSVIVCAYTEMRWQQTRAAVESALAQRPRPAEVLLVVDHNADLAAQARRELAGVLVVESTGTPGLSGARNTGLRAATQPIAAFLDDDAQARPGWLSSLIEPYSDSKVMGTGGSVYPWWPTLRPAWLSPVFDWVVGCSYLGLPESVAPVRNPIGANMSLRIREALEVGGFDVSLGRSVSGSRGCEETELAIRLTASQEKSIILYVPAAAVDHHVGEDRLRFGYFLRRCWHEGVSKATVVRLAGSSAGLERERRHVAVVIPTALFRDLRGFATGDFSAFLRMTLAIAGLATTTAGYLTGCASQARHSRMQGEIVARRPSSGKTSRGTKERG
jgi:glucosyl-dolichyl phosphate glucuronosyltransferase